VTDDDTPRVAKLRQGRAHRTRQTLRDTAARLWTERGYDAVAVSEICDQAGVSKGTFFYYFPTKKDLQFNFYVDPPVAAKWIRDALRISRQWSRVYGLGWVNVYDNPPLSYGGLMNIHGVRKPSFWAFAQG